MFVNQYQQLETSLMELAFAINNRTQPPFYVVYTPVRCTLRLINGQPGATPVSIQLSNNNTQQGGQLVFYTDLTSVASSTLTLEVPGNGSLASFYIGGKLNATSINYNDAAINFRHNSQSLLLVRFTVRARKNANSITPLERDKFLNAFVKLVQSGKYQKFLDMHNEAVSSQIHNRAAFLPWHRIYLLDLERHLQEIDRSVSVPYWDFQAPAPNVFTLDFMGVPTSATVGRLQYSVNNPLNNWQLQNLPSLARIPRFNAQQDRANVETRSTTLGRVPGFNTFASLESNPHGSSHTSFTGPVNFAPTAPQDPLFFMLHANVDRIWAQWQMLDSSNALFDGTNLNAYNPHTFRSPNARIGDFPQDTMWPWNGVTGGERPATAPGGRFINSLFTSFPGPEPKVIDAIDYQGRLTNKPLYFDYDALPFVNSVVAPQSISSRSNIEKLSVEKLQVEINESKVRNARFLAVFSQSVDGPDLVMSLSNIAMLTDKKSIDKAISILKSDGHDVAARVLALSRLLEAISLDEALIKYVLQLLENQNEPADLRKEALRTIETLSFTSPIFPSVKPDIIQVFRGLITDPVHEIRVDIIAYLAKFKDEFIQRVLIQGLQRPDEAVVQENIAVHFLGYDIHAGIYPLLQKIARSSSNNESRSEALYLLAGDPQAKKLLIDTFKNKRERFDIRKNSLIALKSQSLDDFIEIAQNTVMDEQESENIRAISLNAIGHMAVPDKVDKKFINRLKAIDLKILPDTLASGIELFLESQRNDARQ